MQIEVALAVIYGIVAVDSYISMHRGGTLVVITALVAVGSCIPDMEYA